LINAKLNQGHRLAIYALCSGASALRSAHGAQNCSRHHNISNSFASLVSFFLEMGGHVAKKLGDGLMSLFGYPLAHENDAERAVRAALSIQRALADLNRKNAGTRTPTLAARITNSKSARV
jgi:class 3 adenylate cyclase